MDQLQGLDMDQFLAAMTESVGRWGIQVIGAIAVLIVGRMAAGWARRLVAGSLRSRGIDETLVPFLSGIVYALAITLVIIAVLGLFNVPTASFVAVVGAAGLAVGLALQGTLSNFAAGVMLLVFRPFRVGHLVEVSGVLGKVEAIGLFSTTMNTLGNVQAIVPNGEVFGKVIKNFSANEIRRVDMVFGVSYGDDLALARATIERIVKSDERVLADPPPDVEVSELADSSVNFVVRPWVKKDDYWPVRFALMAALKEGVEEAGCSIPFPQRDVHLHEVG